MTPTLCIEPPYPEHLDFIAAHMRSADVLEVSRSHGHSPAEAIAHALADSYESHVILADGVPQLVFGIAAPMQGVGVPWMLGTDGITRWSRLFLRESNLIVRRWERIHAVLTNLVDAENTVAIRWLEWLGFAMTETFALNDFPFIRFEIRNDV